jgi:hypothetical protein
VTFSGGSSVINGGQEVFSGGQQPFTGGRTPFTGERVTDIKTRTVKTYSSSRNPTHSHNYPYQQQPHQILTKPPTTTNN